MSAGEIVAFIDDDAIAEPEWLSTITKAFESENVGAAGGFVYDKSGVEFSWRYGTVNRLGYAATRWQRPATELNFPLTNNFPHLLGTNCAFRKSALLAVGGFDENYEYFLDETDLICRLVDQGWYISQVVGGNVHHKLLASEIRTDGIVTSWYKIIKSKLYFSLVNSHGHHTISDAIKDTLGFVEAFKSDLECAISAGKATASDRLRLEREVDRAIRDALSEGLESHRRYIGRSARNSNCGTFRPFNILAPAGRRRNFCFLSQCYPPAVVGGIGRHIHQLARGVAAHGHQVHVLTKSTSDSVEFEDGLWVHRVRPQATMPPKLLADLSIPQHIWDHSATMLEEVKKISTKCPVDIVHAPIWDCEGLAFLADGSFCLVTGLHTTLKFWHNDQIASSESVNNFVERMLVFERWLLTKSRGLHAPSYAILREVERAYGVKLSSAQTKVVPHGQEDWLQLPRQPPRPLSSGRLRVLFVGRLEHRKGIDVLLSTISRILLRHPHLHFDIVGNDQILGPDGLTYRQAFEANWAAHFDKDRVQFHGEVSEAELRGYYASCDIFVAPSRFESFGLVLLEAMMFSKPIVTCRTGGIVEIIDDNVHGLLAEPGDATSFELCLEKLTLDSALRERLGRAARARYEAFFTSSRMAVAVIEFLEQTARRQQVISRTRRSTSSRSSTSIETSGTGVPPSATSG
jgi:glycosyltransferase involved in cell wall biosynthesis